MERVLCLLLLLCSLTSGELLNNEITEQRKANTESVNVPEQPHPCLSDLHAVLREMSANLAKHEVTIQQLQALNLEQGKKLRELERQTDPMKLQLQDHTTSLKNIEKTLNSTKTHVEVLQRDKSAGQVAFSVGLLASGSGYIGPFNVDTPLVFRNIFSNIQNAYNPNTGYFIAPVRGAFHFEFYIVAGGHDGHAASVKLTKNGEHICIAYEHQTNGYGGSANGATLVLEAGDVVSLVLTGHNRVYDDEYHRSSFSGHLLFTT